MSFIEVIEPEESTGTLKEIYDDLVKSRGKLAMVHKIQSLNFELCQYRKSENCG